MIHFDTILTNLRRDVIRTFAVVDEWFDKEDCLHRYKPPTGGWSTGEILEHITLTSHYLLILIDKGADKCMKLATERVFSGCVARLQFYTSEAGGYWSSTSRLCGRGPSIWSLPVRSRWLMCGGICATTWTGVCVRWSC